MSGAARSRSCGDASATAGRDKVATCLDKDQQSDGLAACTEDCHSGMIQWLLGLFYVCYVCADQHIGCQWL